MISLIALIFIVGLAAFLYFVPVSLMVAAKTAGVPLPIPALIAMRLRGANSSDIGGAMVRAHTANLAFDRDIMEGHSLAGGTVLELVEAQIVAEAAGLDLSFEQAAALQLAGKDLQKSVQSAITPRVAIIEVSTMSKDSIVVSVACELTFRLFLGRALGGAPETTLVARMTEATTSFVGKVQSTEGLFGPSESFERQLIAQGLDAGTMYQIIAVKLSVTRA